ncbi:Alpha/Beta hydrolase protein [Lipomyces oligophaga]|uniref:Alpha/Beta hydrolase protein n=1 Tax=Lipomyces oligophaga TaxID=45792 RepID=UPI0034CE0E96
MILEKSIHDRFSLPEDTPYSSETLVNIAGILVHLYGVEELTAEQREDVTVLFFGHGRTRSYKDGEALAHQLLYNFSQKPHKKGIVVATMDNRNHGIRKVDDVAIEQWDGGNPNHGQDMLSMVYGITVDFQTIIKFLGAYVSELFKPTEFIASGISLSGHVTWNLLATEPRIKIGIPVVGTTDMTALLIHRLGDYKTVADVPEGTPEWPKALEILMKERDDKLALIKDKKILILNGDLDTLVPDRFTKPWVETYAKYNDVTYIHQEETGHYLSWFFVNKITEFVLPELE